MSRNSMTRGAASVRSAGACVRLFKVGTVVALLSVLTACAAATGGGTDEVAGSSSPPPGNTTPPPPTNTAPVTIASDITIELPTDSANLSGSATDDGLPTGNV